MKIIGAGFGRTGTVSIYAALTELGYKVLHLKTIIQMNQLPIWREIFELKNRMNHVKRNTLYNVKNQDVSQLNDPMYHFRIYVCKQEFDDYERRFTRLLYK